MTTPTFDPEPDVADRSARLPGAALALVTAAISGVAVFVNGYGVRRFPDATLYTTAKNVVAGVVLGLAALAVRPRPVRPASRRRTSAGLLAVATIGGSVPFVLFFEGLARTSSTEAAVIHKTLVVWVAILAVPLLGERLSAGHLAAVALLVGGQAIVAGGLPILVSDAGEAMVLAATVLWAIETVVAKRLLRAVHPATLGLARMGLGSAALVVWTVLTGKVAKVGEVSSAGWVLAALTGVLLAAYVWCWFAALSRAPAVDVTALLVFGAVVTAILDAAVNGASLWPDIDGLALITAGIALILVATQRRAPAETTT